MTKERPILFSGPMVRALLDGRKTQTRRAVKGHGIAWLEDCKLTPEFVADPENGLCPYGFAGDRLWVRESWSHDGPDLATVRSRHEDALSGGITYGPYYRATEPAPRTLRWIPSIHMPRWASRITLEVTAVRVERLQDITEADAIAEGINGSMPPTDAYRVLWGSINGAESWALNPWVWVVSFQSCISHSSEGKP